MQVENDDVRLKLGEGLFRLARIGDAADLVDVVLEVRGHQVDVGLLVVDDQDLRHQLLGEPAGNVNRIAGLKFTSRVLGWFNPSE